MSKEMEHIKDRMADFVAFKEELVINEIMCNKIQTIISFCREDLETVVENNENYDSSEKTLIIGWAVVGSKQLSQWTLMKI